MFKTKTNPYHYLNKFATLTSNCAWNKRVVRSSVFILKNTTSSISLLDALVHFKLVLDAVFLLQLLWNSWKPAGTTKLLIDSIRRAQDRLASISELIDLIS